MERQLVYLKGCEDDGYCEILQDGESNRRLFFEFLFDEDRNVIPDKLYSQIFHHLADCAECYKHYQNYLDALGADSFDATSDRAFFEDILPAARAIRKKMKKKG